jgi:hypothetical protein
MARSDVKEEEILYRCQVGSVYPFAETVLPGTGLIGDREPSLERDARALTRRSLSLTVSHPLTC